MPLNNLALQMLGVGQQQKVGTPGFNPGAAEHRPNATNRLDQFIGTPGGSFLMNILAQSGYSTMPQSPVGAIGRAALQTQAQQQKKQQADDQRRLYESMISLNKAKTTAAGQVGGGEPLSAIAKLRADHQAGRVSAEVFQAERDKILRQTNDNKFDQTKIMRGEFRTDTDGLRTSLGALVSAKNLVMQGNPISAMAAFTSFIRSIDNSVVRPAEQAAYSSAAGLGRRLEDEISKLSGKGPLSEKTKRDLLRSIETLEAQMNGIYQRTVDFYNGEAGKYALDPLSVTGIPSAKSSTPKPDESYRGPMSHEYYDDPEMQAIDAELRAIDEQLGTR